MRLGGASQNADKPVTALSAADADQLNWQHCAPQNIRFTGKQRS